MSFEDAIAFMLWAALAVVAAVAVATGGVVWYVTGNGFAGLGALLTVAVAGLLLIRYS